MLMFSVQVIVCILTVWGRHNTEPSTPSQLVTEIGKEVKNVLNGAEEDPRKYRGKNLQLHHIHRALCIH